MRQFNITNIKESLVKLNRSGFFSIISATAINSAMSFIYGIFIVRILSTNDYGVFSYVQNIINFGILFCGFGVNLGILQFCSSNISKYTKFSYCRIAALVGVVSSFFIMVAMILYTYIDRSNTENLTGYVMEFSVLLILYFIKDWITANLRWQFKNREYSRVLNIHSIANGVLAVIGAFISGIHGVIFGICLAYFFSIILGLHYLNRKFLREVHNAHRLLRGDKRQFFSYSVTMCIVNALISVLYTIDLFVVGNIMQDSEKVAMYKTACIIPFALNMVPNSIMTFVYPHIVKNRDNKEWLKKNVKLLYLANGVLNCVIGIALYIFAPIIVNILFGSRYEGILPLFRILIVSYIISASLRTPAANLFGILKKTKTALCVSAGTALISVLISINLVSKFGVIGATYSSVLTFSIVGLVSTLILVRYIQKY